MLFLLWHVHVLCSTGVRLNKPYQVRVPMDIPVFTGTHADLLVLVRTVIFSSSINKLVER